MTFNELNNLIKKYNIPSNVILQSDSGWECDETDMDGIYYNKTKNIIVFTQDFSKYESKYIIENGWEELR